MNAFATTLHAPPPFAHVSALLQGHWALLKQFNQFLPDGHRIEQLPSHLREYDVCHNNMQPVAEPQAEELAWQFFDKLQARFKDSPAKFKSIMRVLLELPSDGESFSKAGTVASEEAASILLDPHLEHSKRHDAIDPVKRAFLSCSKLPSCAQCSARQSGPTMRNTGVR